jgi:hypothetical protein
MTQTRMRKALDIIVAANDDEEKTAKLYRLRAICRSARRDSQTILEDA